jgi:flagellar biosynthesis GTPase FlhF
LFNQDIAAPSLDWLDFKNSVDSASDVSPPSANGFEVDDRAAQLEDYGFMLNFLARRFKALAVSLIFLWGIFTLPYDAQAVSISARSLEPFRSSAVLLLRTSDRSTALLAAVEAPDVAADQDAEVKKAAKEAKELAKTEAKKAKELAKAEAKKLKAAKEAEEELAEAEAKKIKKAEKAEAKKAKELAKAEAKKAKELAKAAATQKELEASPSAS